MKSVCDKFGALFLLDEVGGCYLPRPQNFMWTGYFCQVMSGVGRAYQMPEFT